MKQTHFDFWENEQKILKPGSVANGISSALAVYNNIRENVATIGAWDFNTALGDTIMEKYESLYVQVVELTEVVHKKSGKPANFIVTSLEIAAIFETATAGFTPNPYLPNGDEFDYAGSVNNRWNLYKSKNTPKNELLIGYADINNVQEPFYGAVPPNFEHNETPFSDTMDKNQVQALKYALLKIANFII